MNPLRPPATLPPAQPSTSIEASPTFAGLWQRFACLAYETFLVVAILFIAGWVFTVATSVLRTPFLRPLLQLWLLGVLGVYFVYCWHTTGQTLAMKTWYVRVGQRDGRSLTFKLAVSRFVLALWSIALLGAGFLWALVDRDRQFLHDRLLGTRLYSNRPGRSATAAPAGGS